MAEITVTLKSGSRYDDPWITIRGDSAAGTLYEMGQVMGWSAEEAGRYTLAEGTTEAATTLQALRAVAGQLGGRVETTPAETTPPPAPAPTGDEEADYIRRELAAAKTKDDMRQIYLDHTEILTRRTDLMVEFQSVAATLT